MRCVHSGEAVVKASISRNNSAKFPVLILELLTVLRLSKSEIGRRLHTSPSQLSQLMYPANRTKTVDQLLQSGYGNNASLTSSLIIH